MTGIEAYRSRGQLHHSLECKVQGMQEEGGKGATLTVMYISEDEDYNIADRKTDMQCRRRMENIDINTER